MKKRSIALLLIGIPFSIPILLYVYIIVATIVMSAFGYRVGNGVMFAESVAKDIVDHHLSQDECNDIIYVIEIMGPTIDSLRDYCDYKVSQLSKDPRVCINLMPSSYGISCIGEIWGNVDHDGDCFDKRDVKDLADGELECISISGTVERTYDCENVSLPSLKDQCFAMRGIRDADSKLCSLVLNETYRSICELKIELQKKYPEIPELR